MAPPTRTRRRRGPVLPLVAVVALAGCAQDLHEASWDDLVTARQQDAIDRGWVPPWLPEAATDVAQVDRPATAEVIVRATLPDDVDIAECRPDEDVPDPPSSVVPDDRAWQPDDQGLRLACEDGWSAVRADGTIWAWATDPETP